MENPFKILEYKQSWKLMSYIFVCWCYLWHWWMHHFV